jgi:general secretion pathway protein C
MQNSKKLLNTIFLILFAFSLAFLLNSFISSNLPSYGINKEPEKPFYAKDSYRLASAFIDIKKNAPKPKKQVVVKKEEPKKEVIYNLKTWKLQAIFLSNNQMNSFIMVKDGKDVDMMYVMNEKKGYILTEILKEEAIFERKNQKYSLKMHEDLKIEDAVITEEEKAKENNITENISTEIDSSGDISSVLLKRQDLNYYTKNLDKLMGMVKGGPYKVRGQLKGFKLSYVKRGSILEKVGVRSGDIITAINGDELNSFSKAQQYYKNISQMNNATLTILRNGVEKEIEYEVE